MAFSNKKSVSLVQTDVKREIIKKELQNQIEVLGAIKDQMEAEVKARQKAHEDYLGASEDITSLLEQKSNLNNELFDLGAKINTAKSELSKYNGIKELISEAKSELERLNNQKNELSLVENHLENGRNDLFKLQNDYNEQELSLQSKIDVMKSEICNFEEKISVLKSEESEKTKEVNDLVVKLEDLNKRVSASSRELDKLLTKIAESKKQAELSASDAKNTLETELSSKKREFDQNCAIKIAEIEKLQGELSEKIKWQEADRNYLKEVKADLESTYKVKIKRVI